MKYEDYDFSKFDEHQKEAEAIKKDISTARGLIADALSRYKKVKLKARSKKQAEDLETMFKPLEGYGSQREIQDAFGWDVITEKDMDRLNALWEARETYITKSGKFEDRVTKMIEKAMWSIGDEYVDEITEVENVQRMVESQMQENDRRNQAAAYERYSKGL